MTKKEPITLTELQPKVSIKTSTYNHGKFIAQAIESVLMQEVDFDYEIIIGEDCSSDNTRGIVIDYQKKYPDKIRLILNKNNMGMHYNFLQTLNACRGQYVAILDGDDYWTSPHKLQKQVNIMEAHPGCSICFHNIEVVYEDGKSAGPYFENTPPCYTIEDLLINNFIPSCSTVFRNRLFDMYPSSFDEIPFGDWPLHVLNAKYGKICYIDEVMGVWRHHAGGFWTKGGKPSIYHLISCNVWNLKFYEIINKHLEYQYDHIISQRIAIHKEKLKKLQDIMLTSLQEKP